MENSVLTSQKVLSDDDSHRLRTLWRRPRTWPKLKLTLDPAEMESFADHFEWTMDMDEHRLHGVEALASSLLLCY